MALASPRRTARALALLAASVVLPSGLVAQATPQVAGDPDLSGQEASQLVTLEFPGGNLAAYVELLREKFDVNAVVAPDVSDLPMPPLSLKKVSRGTAMNLIEAMSRSLSGDSGGVSVNALADQEGNPVYIVDLRATVPQAVAQAGIPAIPPRIPRALRGSLGVPVAGPGAPQTVRTVRVYSIKVLTQPVPGRGELGLPPDDVLTAIDTALGLSGDESAQVKYHPETGLLFVHGTPSQLEAVGTLIQTLNEDQMMLRKTPPVDPDEVRKLRDENEALRAQIAALSAELKELMLRVGKDDRTPRKESSRP